MPEIIPTEKDNTGEEPESVLSIDDEKAIKRLEGVLDLKKFVPTTWSAVRLHIFSFLINNPEASEDEIKRELKKLENLSEREKVCMDLKNPLPTIGVEIEIPNNYLRSSDVAVLKALDIPNYPEDAYDDIWEVNPDYSYSAEVQARIIQELASLDMLPIDQGFILSLHVNFGMPAGINKDILARHRGEVYLLNDIITYAYTSAERIEFRKTHNSVTWTGDAQASEKNKRDGESLHQQSDNQIVRLELRAGEFKDYPTFRMLSESQQMVAMFIANLKIKENLPHNFLDACLADVWKDFSAEITDFLRSEDLLPNDVDFDQNRVINKLKYTDLQDKTRAITFKYTQKIKEIIGENLD